MNYLNITAQTWRSGRNFVLGVGALLSMAGFTGCAGIPLADQRLVSKPNMTFEDSPALAYQAKLLFQTEPGSGFGAGGKAAGCTSCR